MMSHRSALQKYDNVRLIYQQQQFVCLRCYYTVCEDQWPKFLTLMSINYIRGLIMCYQIFLIDRRNMILTAFM